MTDETELAIRRRLAPTDGLWAIMEPVVPTTHPAPVAGHTQNGAILTWLRAGHSLTALEALDRFGCNRLAARVADLRAAGHPITAQQVTLPNGKRVARYTYGG